MENTANSNSPPDLDRSLRALTSTELEPWLWEPRLIGSPSSWWTHVPFAFWLISVCRPRVFVELGTHYGVSYAAFCEAVQRARTGTRCFAVDTWRGDDHAGFYGDEVFHTLNGFNNLQYSSFSRLLRCTFKDALDEFSNATIDLLHIDGRHGYEDVKEDFESWRPKLSERGVVLLHDISIRGRGYGVHKLFGELKAQFPHFEFVHGFGLGLLSIGRQVAEPIRALCALDDHARIGLLRERAAQVGSLWLVKTQLHLAHEDTGARLPNFETSSRFLPPRAPSMSRRSPRLERPMCRD